MLVQISFHYVFVCEVHVRVDQIKTRVCLFANVINSIIEGKLEYETIFIWILQATQLSLDLSVIVRITDKRSAVVLHSSVPTVYHSSKTSFAHFLHRRKRRKVKYIKKTNWKTWQAQGLILLKIRFKAYLIKKMTLSDISHCNFNELLF